ncbi:MAG: hypothetical protein AAFR47_12150 [Pseudomonadota bacterium]
MAVFALLTGTAAAEASPRADQRASAVLCNTGTEVFTAAAEVRNDDGRFTRAWQPRAPGTCNLLARGNGAMRVGVGVWSAEHGLQEVDSSDNPDGCLPRPPEREAPGRALGLSADAAEPVMAAIADGLCPAVAIPVPVVAHQVVPGGATYLITFSVEPVD